MPLLAGAAATVTMSVSYSIIQFLLDVSAPVSGVLLRQLLATLILNTLLALPVYAIARRWLSRSLPQRPRGRRRQSSSAALSPLQQGLRTQGQADLDLMIDPVGDRRPPISPQLAWRVALLGGIALALFAIIFFRLWYLQVLSGDQYLAEANDNQVRQERIQAPRGDIVDRNGETSSRTAGRSSSRSAPPACPTPSARPPRPGASG